jgi:multidrug resistance protein MdtO
VASRGEALSATATPGQTLDQAGIWFWNFLKTELTPYPGRSWVVGRMTISATIVMLLVMTFRLPSGFLGAIYTIFLSRENPTATFQAGVRTVVAFALGTAYTIVGVTMLVDDPTTRFLWISLTLFIAFYLIRIIPNYGAAVAFGFMIAGAIPLWDQTTFNVNTRVENTLWLAFVVLVGTGVTIAVEYVFRRVHPATDLAQAIEARLQAVESVLRNIAAGVSSDAKSDKEISLFSNVGTSRLRRLLIRSGYSSYFIAQMNAAVALLGRLVDLAASLHVLCLGRPDAVSAADRERCSRLADYISILYRDFQLRQFPRAKDLLFPEQPSQLPFLTAMERIVALIPQAFSGSENIANVFIPSPMDEEVRERLLVPDAFSNPSHFQFALRGMIAATACFVTYTAIDWRGLSTSIATCIITALSTIGASRQKQFLRLTGTAIGGFVFGMGAQIFVLPQIDSIAGFTLLFAVVTAIAAWIATASPRLSYLGVQVAFAYYAINLQEFTIQTSLAVARDRVFGVLLGLISMGLIFDRLWVRNALDEMQAAFSRNLQMFAELTEQLLKDNRDEAVKRVRELRDRINSGFDVVRAQSDAIIFEFGASRERKLKIRDDIRRWQPPLRTLLQVQITFSQYRLQRPLKELPEPVAQALITFEKDTACMAHQMANEIQGKTSETVPDLAASAARLHEEIRKSYEERGLPLSAEASDVISLTQNLASILTALHEDIHSTFASRSHAPSRIPQSGLGTDAYKSESEI